MTRMDGTTAFGLVIAREKNQVARFARGMTASGLVIPRAKFFGPRNLFSMTTIHKIRLGVVGLGRAFTLMLPTFVADERIALVGAADPRPEARHRFESEFGARAYDSIEPLCDDRSIEAIYVASPH